MKTVFEDGSAADEPSPFSSAMIGLGFSVTARGMDDGLDWPYPSQRTGGRMRMLNHMRTIRSLMVTDVDAHIGDIAILKCDIVGLGVRPELEASLAPVTGWQPDVDLDVLRGLDEGTFGRAYVGFLDENQLAPFVITDAVAQEIRERNAYGIRYSGTHDMLHVLLGFGPDWKGEMGVLAFTVGQRYNRVLWLQAMAAWLTYPFWSRFRLGALYRAWTRGIRLGRRAPFLLGVRLEEMFERPLVELQADLGLQGHPTDPR